MSGAPHGAPDTGPLANWPNPNGAETDRTRGAVLKHARTQQTLTVHGLLEWHRLLFESDDADRNEVCGALRGYEVEVYGRVAVAFSTLPTRLNEFLARLDAEVKAVCSIEDDERLLKMALLTTAQLYLNLVTLQPFADGNKRIGRHLVLWAIVRFELPIDFDPMAQPVPKGFRDAVVQGRGLPLYRDLIEMLEPT